VGAKLVASLAALHGIGRAPAVELRAALSHAQKRRVPDPERQSPRQRVQSVQSEPLHCFSRGSLHVNRYGIGLITDDEVSRANGLVGVGALSEERGDFVSKGAALGRGRTGQRHRDADRRRAHGRDPDLEWSDPRELGADEAREGRRCPQPFERGAARDGRGHEGILYDSGMRAEGVLPLTSTSEVLVPPRGRSFMKFSFDFPEPSVEIERLKIGFLVFTYAIYHSFSATVLAGEVLRSARFFQHLSHPAPGRGSTGVHEAGFQRWNPATLFLTEHQIPTLNVVDDTFEAHRAEMEAVIRRARERAGI